MSQLRYFSFLGVDYSDHFLLVDRPVLEDRLDIAFRVAFGVFEGLVAALLRLALEFFLQGRVVCLQFVSLLGEFVDEGSHALHLGLQCAVLIRQLLMDYLADLCSLDLDFCLLFDLAFGWLAV